LPFDGSALEIMMKKQEDEPPAPRTLAPEVPEDLDRLCADLLRRRPEARPAASDIQRRLGTRAVEPRPSPKRSSTSASRLVGRERQLAELFDAFAESATQATALFVHGYSGM